jgi:hypothetical protein
MNARSLPPLLYLQECFELGGNTGIIWKNRPLRHFANDRVWRATNLQYAGKMAGRKAVGGRRDHAYWSTRVGEFGSFLNHRIVLSLVMKCCVPESMQVDHIDHDGTNNDPANLRLVSHAGNQRHRKGAQKNNLSGSRGVYWAHHKSWGNYARWVASITVNGKKLHLGYFDTEEEARGARLSAELKYWVSS